jgi:toxin CcdB
MARFDVYRYLGSKRDAPYVIDLQADSVSALLGTRIVAPLRPLSELSAARRFLPVVNVDGRDFVISIPELAGIPSSRLAGKVPSLSGHHFDIVDALDFVFQGY